jgi:hypothetical protein
MAAGGPGPFDVVDRAGSGRPDERTPVAAGERALLRRGSHDGARARVPGVPRQPSEDPRGRVWLPRAGPRRHRAPRSDQGARPCCGSRSPRISMRVSIHCRHPERGRRRSAGRSPRPPRSRGREPCRSAVAASAIGSQVWGRESRRSRGTWSSHRSSTRKTSCRRPTVEEVPGGRERTDEVGASQTQAQPPVGRRERQRAGAGSEEQQFPAPRNASGHAHAREATDRGSPRRILAAAGSARS